MVMPFLLAIGTIFRIGLRRRTAWSAPICRKCRYDLCAMDPNCIADCPACGASLTESKALLFAGRQGRRWGLVVWAGVLMAMPFLGVGAVFVAYYFVGPSPGGLGFLSTQQLIQERLPNQIDEPRVWRELEARLKAGSLSQQDVDAAIKELTSHMTTTRPQGWDSPLSWQKDFIKSAGQAGLISEPVLLALCDAFYGPNPVIQPPPRLREEKSGFHIEIKYGNTWGSHSDLGLQLVWQVNRVLLDDKPLDVRVNHKGGGNWSGYHDGSLDAGDHQLTVEVECAYIDEGKLIGLNPDNLSKGLWPTARKRWTQTISAPLKVFSADQPLVSLATNPGKHPGGNGGIAIGRFAIQRNADGGKLIVLKTSFIEVLPTPLSYDVAVAFDEQTVELGHMWAVQNENHRSSGGGQMQKRLDSLDSSIRRADIILTPNPRHIEHRSEVSEIWGQKIILPNVPLERLDLE